MTGDAPKKSLLREYAETFLSAILMALVVQIFFVQAFKIPTGSMRPTFLEGDRILVNKVLYGIRIPFTAWRLPKIREPERGDLVVFRSVDNSRRAFIKRLVAVGGDEVEIRNFRLWINGKPLDEPPIFQSLNYYNRGAYGRRGRPMKVPKDHYFFLGDNSASSRDSRYWGFLPKSHLIGRAFVVYWPLHRVRLLRNGPSRK